MKITAHLHVPLSCSPTVQRRLDVVKMDIEGYEWESMMAAAESGALDDVRQLFWETHIYLPLDCKGEQGPSHQEYVRFLRLWRSLYARGFRIYYTHRWGRCARETQMINVRHVNQDWMALHEQQQDNFYRYSFIEKASVY